MEKPAKAASNSAAAIAVIHKGTVLLAKRTLNCHITGKPTPYGGYWSILGGTLDKGETLKECAIRELKEEAGITLNPKNVKFLKKIPEKKINFYIYYCKLSSFPLVKLNQEHTEHGFFSINSLDCSPSPIDAKVAKAIQEI